MSVTYPIEFVSKAPSSQRLTISNRQSITQANASYQTTVVHTASQWALSWSWPRMSHSDAEGVNAWITKLKGQVGTFKFYPYQAYAYLKSGLSLAQSGYAYNDTIQVAGWTPTTATGLRAGQYFQIDSQLLVITDAAAGSDANGLATISFAPELRLTYAAGTTVNFNNPCGVFRLAAGEGLGFGLDPDRTPEFSSMSAMEDCN